MRLRQFTILLFGILNTEILQAQITGNTNTSDPKAELISVDHRAALCGKEWRCLELVEVIRGVRGEFERNGKSVEFRCDGQFRYSFNKVGNWTIINDQFLKISMPDGPNSRSLLNGAYSIYELSDSTLVLEQILTSNGDWTREYTFTSSSKLTMSHRQATVYQYPDDSLKDGKRVKYFDNGQVLSIEQFHLAKRKITAEELFLNYDNVPHDRYERADSTMLVFVPNGEWSYYYPDGKIQAKHYYDDEGKEVGRWVRYFSDGRLDESRKYDKDGQLEFWDQYQYQRDEAWPIIKRQALNGERMFVIGSNDSAQFNQIEFYETGQADTYLEKNIVMKNLSARKLTIAIPANSIFDTRSTQVEVDPHDSAMLTLRIRIPAGVMGEQIMVTSPEWRFGLTFHTLGYHLTNADFESRITRTLPSKLYIYRTSDDYELEIANSAKVKFLAVSKQMNMIELKRGTYQFTLIGPARRRTIDVEIRN